MLECVAIGSNHWPEVTTIKRLYYLGPISPGSPASAETPERNVSWALGNNAFRLSACHSEECRSRSVVPTGPPRQCASAVTVRRTTRAVGADLHGNPARTSTYYPNGRLEKDTDAMTNVTSYAYHHDDHDHRDDDSGHHCRDSDFRRAWAPIAAVRKQAGDPMIRQGLRTNATWTVVASIAFFWVAAGVDWLRRGPHAIGREQRSSCSCLSVQLSWRPQRRP